MNVIIVKIFGVRSGSIPNFDRRNNGVAAERNVGIVACKIVTGAIVSGSDRDGKVFNVASTVLGG